MDDWTIFLRELASHATEPGVALGLCRRQFQAGGTSMQRLIAWSLHSIYGEIEAYRRDYDEVSSSFGGSWAEELARVQARALAPFATQLSAIAKRGADTEARTVEAADELVKAWSSFDRESVAGVLQRSEEKSRTYGAPGPNS